MVKWNFPLKCLAGLALALAAAAVIGSSAFAEEEAAKKTTATGVVAVEKGADGAIITVVVKGDAKVKLVLDDKAKEVAKLEGKTVEVTGTLDAAGALKVESFKEVVPAAKKTE